MAEQNIQINSQSQIILKIHNEIGSSVLPVDQVENPSLKGDGNIQ